MATDGDGRAPYESGGAGGKFRKRPFRRSISATPYERPPTAVRNNNPSMLKKLVDPASRLIYAGAHRLFDVFRKSIPPLSIGPPGINEEPQDLPQEEGQNGNSASISAVTGISELEQMLQQKTFTRSEIERLTSLLNSKTTESPSDDSLKKHGHKSDNFHANISTPIVTSRILEEIASPAELAKSYMGSRQQALRQDSKLFQKTQITPVAQKTANSLRDLENGFVTPRSRARSAMYTMARTPYSRSPIFSQKGIRSVYGHIAASTSSQGQEGKMTLKRRSSVLDDDIGSGGPLRRIRQKANLLSQRDKKELGYPSFQQPDGQDQKLLLTNEPEPKVAGYFSVPTKSTQTANKILQHLEKPTPKEKGSSEMREKSSNKLTLDMLHGQALRSLEKVDSPKFLMTDTLKDRAPIVKITDLPSKVPEEPTSERKDKTEENCSRKFPIPRNMLTSVNGDMTDTLQDKTVLIGNTNLPSKAPEERPQKKRAFQMSAPEDSIEIDDDDDDVLHDNGHVSLPLGENNKPEIPVSDIIATPELPEALRTPSFVKNNKLETSAADIIKTPKLPEVSKTLELAVENNKPVFPSVVKVPELAGNVTSFPSTTTTQTFVVPQSTLKMEKIAPEKDSNSFLFSTDAKKVSPFQFSANEPLEFKPYASSDPKASDSISVFNSVTKKDHLTISVSNTDENGGGNRNRNGNDRKSANLIGKSESLSPAVSAATSTNGIFSFGTSTKNLSTPNTTASSNPPTFPSLTSFSASAGTSTTAATISTTTTTHAAIFSTSVTPPVFSFGSATSTAPTTSTAETGNPSTSSPFSITSFATTTTAAAAGSALFGFSSPAAATSTTNTTAGSGLFGFSSPAAATSTTTTGSGLFGFSSPAAATSTTTGTGLFGFSSPAAATSTTTTTTTGTGLFGFSSPAAATSTTTTTTTTGTGLFGFSSPAATTSTTTAQSQGSFFNFTSGSQSNTQASSNSTLFGSSAPAFGSSPSFGIGSVGPTSETKSGNSTSGPTTSIFGSTWQQPQKSSGFSSTFTSSPSSSVFTFGASSTPVPSFVTAGTTNSSFAGPSVFGNSTPVFGAVATSSPNNNNNDQMSMEDSMAEDSMQTASPVSPFGQAPAGAPGFMFGSATPTAGAVSFQFGGQPNQALPPQNPFQSSSLEFNGGGGSFSLGSGGEKSNRRIVRVVKSKNRGKKF